jgi:acetyl-CoA carboxylase carboxyltransferase component
MVGSKSEQGGIIKDGAKMVNAVSNSVVPKFTVMLGTLMVQETMPCVEKPMTQD